MICGWYRPPCRGKILSIANLREEYMNLHANPIGTFIIGDMNVHQIRWLEYSRENSPEGAALESFCGDFGFRECIRQPTRNEYLLDLMLTDIDGRIKSEVLPKIADHLCTCVRFSLNITRGEEVRREVWQLEKTSKIMS